MSHGISVMGTDNGRWHSHRFGGEQVGQWRGKTVQLLGDPVASHAPCPVVPIHCAAVMSEGSSWATLDGIPIVRQGNSASCGHAATGRPWWTFPD